MMKVKVSNIFMGLLGAFLLNACSSDEVLPDNNPVVDGENSRFMAVNIRNVNDVMSRAGGDQLGNTYEEGLAGENKVEKIRFYFFGPNGAAFNVTTGSNAVNWVDVTPENGSEFESDASSDKPGMPNVEKNLKAVIVLSADNNASFKDLKSMVAVVNPAKAASKLGSGSKDLESLRTIADDYAIPQIADNDGILKDQVYNNKSENLPLFLMTSSVYGTDKEYQGCQVYIEPSKLKTNKDAALQDFVEVYVERVLAKVRMTAQWKAGIEATPTNQGIYVALKDKEGNNITYGTDNKRVYALLMGWGMQMTSKESYLFKNIGSDYKAWDNSLGSWWNHPAYHRSYWALNSDGALPLRPHYHKNANAKIGTQLTSTVDGVTTTINYNGDFCYTQENAATNEDGSVDGYEPNTAVTNRTIAYVRANLVTRNGDNYETLSLAEWAGEKYVEEDLPEAMLGMVNNQIWIKKVTTPTDKIVETDWATLPTNLIELVTAEDANKADQNSENSPRYLCFIQLKSGWKDILKEEGYDLAFYDGKGGQKLYLDENASDKEKDNVDAVNKKLLGVPGAKVWRNGESYYYTTIKHLPESGKYGVVRNHIYEILLEDITGLGTPVFIPDNGKDIEIIPQKPSPDDYYLGARINILSWRVVENNTTLDW